jgi:Uma2 family endonuclease
MSIAAAWPDHLLSLVEWEQLEEDRSRRYELVEGVLLAVPRPAPMHQRAMMRLGAELDRQLPADLTALADVEVVLTSGDAATVRAPDLAVVANDRAEANPARLDAADVLVAIEIVSPGTGRTDQVTKLAGYAVAGIGHYWLIELGPPVSLTVYTLPAGGFAYALSASGGGVLDLELPVPLRLDVDGLTRR